MTKEERLEKIRSACNKDVIHLADIMTAIRDTNKHSGYAIDQDGLFIKVMPNHIYGWDTFASSATDTPPVWNIYKDDLVLQSNECLEFISNLL